MRGDNHSDWNNTNGIRLLSRDSVRSSGSGVMAAMQGSDVYREVLYELQNEDCYDYENGESEDSPLSSDRDDDVIDQESASRGPPKRSFKTQRPLDVDDVSSLVQQGKDRPRRRENTRLSLDFAEDEAVKLYQPSTNQPGRSILRQLGTCNEDDSTKARNRLRVTFKESSDLIPSPLIRRASVAEANPSYRAQAQVSASPRHIKEDCDVTDESPSCHQGQRPGDRRRRHSISHISAPVISDPLEQVDENCIASLSIGEENGTRAWPDGLDGDDDSGVKCEVVHSFTPRPRARRCSYAGINGYETKYTREDSEVSQTPRVAASLTPRAGSKATPAKKISPSNGMVKTPRKITPVKGGKKDAQKGRKDTSTPNSRRHSVI